MMHVLPFRRVCVLSSRVVEQANVLFSADAVEERTAYWRVT